MKFILEIRKKDIKDLELYFEGDDVEVKGVDAIKECFWLPDNRSVPGEINLRDTIKITPLKRKSVPRKG